MKSMMPFRGHHLSIHILECIFDIHFSSTDNLLVMAEKTACCLHNIISIFVFPTNIPNLMSYALKLIRQWLLTCSSPCLKTEGTPSLPAGPALPVHRSKCTGRLEQIVFCQNCKHFDSAKCLRITF